MHKIKIIKSMKDNYIFSIEKNKKSWIIDPGEYQPVKEHLQENNISLAGVLITHHHYDHTGGLKQLTAENPNIKVIGSYLNKNEFINHKVKESDEVELTGIEMKLKVMETPGHTLDHVCYYNNKYIFCGDTLFSGGCGKVFEGSYEQMAQSIKRIDKLNEKALIYCAHEYTIKNLEFNKTIEPKNIEIDKRIKQIEEENGNISIPTCLIQERKINPYLRYNKRELNQEIKDLYGEHYEEIYYFKTIRKRKDNF